MKAMYTRWNENLDDDEPVMVSINKETFENEAKEFHIHDVDNFLQSSQFTKDFEVCSEGRKILSKKSVY
jgi:hypothetical protein